MNRTTSSIAALLLSTVVFCSQLPAQQPDQPGAQQAENTNGEPQALGVHQGSAPQRLGDPPGSMGVGPRLVSIDPGELDNLKQQLRFAEERAMQTERQAEVTRDSFRMSLLILLFGLPAVFIAGFFFARYKNYEHLNATMRNLLEKGVTVPPEIYTPAVRKNLGWSDLRKGFIWIWAGIGLMIFLAASFHGPAASIGLVPLFIGGAYIIFWLMDRRSKPKST